MLKKKYNYNEIMNLGQKYATEVYRNRQSKTFDGDPVGFAVVFNKRSQKFSNLAINSVRLNRLSENDIHIYNVYSNGSCEPVK